MQAGRSLRERKGGSPMNAQREIPLFAYRALFFLLLADCISVGLFFPAHAFSIPAWGMRLSAIGLAALALLTLYALWQCKVWGPWSALAVLSAILTIDLYAWATNVERMWSIV